jgi:hypothetical protein
MARQLIQDLFEAATHVEHGSGLARQFGSEIVREVKAAASGDLAERVDPAVRKALHEEIDQIYKERRAKIATPPVKRAFSPYRRPKDEYENLYLSSVHAHTAISLVLTRMLPNWMLDCD